MICLFFTGEKKSRIYSKNEMLEATSVLIHHHLWFKSTLATKIWRQIVFFSWWTRCKVGVVVSPTFLEHEVSLLTPNFRLLSTVFITYCTMGSVFKNSTLLIFPRFSQRAKKFKTVQAKKKLVKSNSKSKLFFVKLHFWQF